MTSRRTLLAGAALAAAALLAPPFLAESPPVEDAPTTEIPKLFEVGKPIDPAITLTDIDGKEHALGALRGKTVVIDFWSYRCPYHVAWEGKLIDHAKRYAGKDVVFLAINSNKTEVDPGAEDPYAKIRKYAKKAKINYPVLIDPGNVVADRFRAKTTPHVYVIDPKGVLRYEGSIDNDLDMRRPLPEDEIEPYLADAIDAVLAGEKIERTNTRPVGCSIKRVKGKASS
jgi:peroxiredoxin